MWMAEARDDGVPVGKTAILSGMAAFGNRGVFFLDRVAKIYFCVFDIVFQVLARSVIGNPVKFGDGPAAVTGNESRRMSLAQRVGKARRVGRSGSQKTCLKNEPASRGRGSVRRS